MMSELEEKLESPCIRNCCLDANDICLGCHRSMEEIMAWSTLSINEQKIVLERAKNRSQ